MRRITVVACGVLVLFLSVGRANASWGTLFYSEPCKTTPECSLTPEEKRVRAFWCEYHEAMKKYCEQHGAVDWVEFFKGPGSHINTGANGSRAVPGSEPSRTEPAKTTIDWQTCVEQLRQFYGQFCKVLEESCLTLEEKRLRAFWREYTEALKKYCTQQDQSNTCGPGGSCGRINYAPVFVSPVMQWAAPSCPMQGPPVNTMGAMPGGYSPGPHPY